MARRHLGMAATLTAAMLTWSGWATAQDTAAPSTNKDQSATHEKHSKATAKQSAGENGAQTTDAGSSSGSQLSAKDKTFLRKAAQGGMEEVEIGQMVADKAQNPDVKQFAQRMVQDHSKANDELKSLAQQKGYTLPTEMGAEGKAMKAKLEKLSGDQLDKAYMSNMVKDHTKDVNEFKMASQGAKDGDVKSFAEKTLPTLQDHLKQAKEVAGKTGAMAGKKSSETAQQ